MVVMVAVKVWAGGPDQGQVGVQPGPGVFRVVWHVQVGAEREGGRLEKVMIQPWEPRLEMLVEHI